jgi:hypothetical protein
LDSKAVFGGRESAIPDQQTVAFFIGSVKDLWRPLIRPSRIRQGRLKFVRI